MIDSYNGYYVVTTTSFILSICSHVTYVTLDLSCEVDLVRKISN